MSNNIFGDLGEMETTTIKDVAYQRLREAILDGRLRPGERLIENRLADMLNISRTPLREALIRLRHEGYIRRMPHRGAIVAEMTVGEIAQLNAIRSTLEGLAAQRCAERVARGEISQEELAELDTTLEKMSLRAQAHDIRGHLDLGRSFHEQLWQLSGNPWLETMIRQVMNSVERYRHLVPELRTVEIVADHRAIQDAIIRGDAEAAEQLMRAHLTTAGHYYVRAIHELGASRTEASTTRNELDGTQRFSPEQGR